MNHDPSSSRPPKQDFDARWWLVPLSLAGGASLLALIGFAATLDAPTRAGPAAPEVLSVPADVAAASAPVTAGVANDNSGEEQPATF